MVGGEDFDPKSLRSLLANTMLGGGPNSAQTYKCLTSQFSFAQALFCQCQIVR